jgi:hypothetical protein
MQVRLEDVFDLQALSLCRFEVNLDISLGVNHHRLAVRAKQIRGMSETSQIELLEVECRAHCAGLRHKKPPTLRYRKQSTRWSFTIPTACMNA